MSGFTGLAIAIAISLAPSLMFLGLWHGLMYLRDDDLIEQAREMEHRRPQYAPGSAPISTTPVSGSGSDATVVCQRCSTHNATGVTYCRNCLAELPDH